MSLFDCPYYQGTGTCESGCATEPSCITDEPLEGWPERIARAAKILRDQRLEADGDRDHYE